MAELVAFAGGADGPGIFGVDETTAQDELVAELGPALDGAALAVGLVAPRGLSTIVVICGVDFMEGSLCTYSKMSFQ